MLYNYRFLYLSNNEKKTIRISSEINNYNNICK